MFHIVLQMWVLQNVCDFVSSCSISQNFVSSCSISQKWSWARFCNFHFSKFCKYAFRFASFARFSQLAVCWWNLSLRMIHDLTSLMVSVTISVEDSDVCFKWWSNVLPVYHDPKCDIKCFLSWAKSRGPKMPRDRYWVTATGWGRPSGSGRPLTEAS